MKTRVKWVENVTFMATSESGHSVIMDGAPEAGGENRGFRPMEMLLVGMAGCTAFDVVQMLKKGRQNISDVSVEVDADRAEDHPKVFTKIHLLYTITGNDIKDAQVKRAVELSTEKYCSASIMLGATAKLVHEYRIIDE